MDSISNQLPNFNGFNPFAPKEEDLLKTQQSGGSLSIQQSSNIVLTTEEGDRVTLSSAASFEASYATYSSQAVLDGGSSEVSAASYSLSQSFAFELSIEGDLNEEELKDITKALKTIEKITSDFYAGKSDKALERSEKIAKLDSISSFEAVLQYSKALSFESETTSTRPAPSLPESNPQPALPVLPTVGADVSNPATKPPIPETPQSPGPNPTPSVIDPIDDPVLSPVTVDQAASSTPKPPASLLEQLSDSIFESDVIPQKLGKYLDRFLSRVFSKMGDQKESNEDGLKETTSIQTELVRRLEFSLERQSTQSIQTESNQGSERQREAHSEEHGDS